MKHFFLCLDLDLDCQSNMEKGLSSLFLQYHSDRREETGRGLGLSTSNALQVGTLLRFLFSGQSGWRYLFCILKVVTEALASGSKLSPFRHVDTLKFGSNVTPSHEAQEQINENDQQEFEEDEDGRDPDQVVALWTHLKKEVV